MSNQLPDAVEPCCPRISRDPIAADRVDELAPMFKALGDPVRLRMLVLIAGREGGESCVCDIGPSFDLSQPTISHHLKVLREAGLLGCERRGTWVYYRVLPGMLEQLSGVLEQLSEMPAVESGAPAASVCNPATAVEEVVS